jgi:lipopolysaccharide/colanic/teichoic acid biosynthesis glycosyltransferase
MPASPRLCQEAAPGLPRWFNLTASALALSLLSPLLVLIWLLIRLDSPGQALFAQDRIGLNGRRFRCLKFRTMASDLPEPSWRISDFGSYRFNPGGSRDPRVTRIGTVLRRTSIDELPQLLNVVLGEMALVGPRPEIPEIVAQYPPSYHRRHAVLPGITGEAQVSGRADLSYAETIAFDLRYVRRRSRWHDLAIIWRTVAVVIGGTGAR